VTLATATLLVLIAGHAVRETARDALFLADLPATRLPWAYLAIAVGAIAVGAANRLLLDRFSHLRLLIGTLVIGVIVDLGFWQIASAPTPGTLLGLYAWTGLLGTAVTLQLWLHLADVFDVAEAKRVFPWVAAGGLTGAVLGSVLAGALLEVTETRSLLLASAALLLVSAGVASLLSSRHEIQSPQEDRSSSPSLLELLGSSYLRQITLLAVCVAMLATGIDFVFKDAVERSIPTDELGSFFARFHAVVNLAALGLDLLLASWLLRHLGVTRAIAVFPVLILASAGAFAGLGGLAAALLLKAVDEALRQSLYEPSAQVLYQPLSVQTRNAAKTAVESIGRRGGQALSSLLILGVASAGLGAREIGAGLVALALLALFALRGLRREYVARFQQRLRGLAGEARAEIPSLELDSLEVLVSNLSSPEDAEVLTAIDLLESYGRSALVSPLLLHHPSPKVVLRALGILQTADHPHLDGILERLLEHGDAEVRAGALNAVAARDGETAQVERLLHSDPSPAVRMTAVIALAARHEDPAQARAFLAKLLDGAAVEEKIAVARALPRLPCPVASESALRLIADRDVPAAKELAQALSNETELDPGWIPTLIALLSRREARPPARSALLSQGERALAALDSALRDPDTDDAVRRHLPRTIHRFGSAAAAAILVRAMPKSDPAVCYKILRGLGRMRANDPDLALPEAELAEEAKDGLERAIGMLHFRVGYYTWSGLHGVDGGDARDLLGEVLEDKEARALERVFRVLHIAEPQAEFDAIFEALRTPGHPMQAEGLELIEHLVAAELRDGVLAMVGPDAAADRLRRATRSHGLPHARALADALPADGEVDALKDRQALDAALEPLFGQMLADEDPILVSIAQHRWTEISDALKPLAGARRQSPR